MPQKPKHKPDRRTVDHESLEDYLESVRLKIIEDGENPEVLELGGIDSHEERKP